MGRLTLVSVRLQRLTPDQTNKQKKENSAGKSESSFRLKRTLLKRRFGALCKLWMRMSHAKTY